MMNLKKQKAGSKILLGALIIGVVGLCTEQLIVGKSPANESPAQTQQVQKEEPKVQTQQTQKEEPKVQTQQTQKEEPKVQTQQTQKEEPKAQTQQTQKEEPKVQTQQNQKEEPKAQTQQTQKEEPKAQTQQTQKEEPKAQTQQNQKEEPKAQTQQNQKEEPKAQTEQAAQKAGSLQIGGFAQDMVTFAIEAPAKPVKPQTQEQRQAKIPEERKGKLGPQCEVGDSWTVETSTAQIKSATESNTDRVDVQWKFTVESIEKIAERDCFRIQATCLEPGHTQPEVTLWIDRDNGMLVRMTSRVMVQGEWSEFTETYVSNDGSAVPVLGVIPALPFDMPVFESEDSSDEVSVKSLDSKSYEILSGNVTEKALDTLAFTQEVNQTVTKPEEVFMKSLDDTLPQDETVQVEINGGRQTVKQVWAPGNPWPVYSDNGVTEARLIDFVPADEVQE